MTSNELLYVTTISKFGSIGKAAKILNMNQSSLRRSLQKIEENLSVTLFKRTSAGLILTEAGNRYVDMANSILSLSRNMEEEIQNETQLKSGVISIGIEKNYTQGILPYVFPKFKSSYPNIMFEIVESNSEQLAEMLLTGRLDLAIIHLPLSPDYLERTILFEEPLVLVTDKNHKLPETFFREDNEGQRVIDIKKMKDQKFILQQRPNKLREKCDEFFVMADLNPNIVIEIQNLENARRLAGMGSGYTILPISYVNVNDIRFETTYFYLDKQFDPTWKTVVAYADRSALSNASHDFLNMLIDFSITM